MTKKRKFIMLFSTIAIIFCCLLTCFNPTIQNVYASSISVVGGYTDVMEDLQQDANFNADDYVLDENNCSLQVVTIAESGDNELFVYVYQPSSYHKNLRATSISMSTAYRTAKQFNIYYLDFINCKGAFYKYIVKNFKVSNATTRSYEISEIFRKWNADFDAGSSNNNTINEVTFAVGKQYTFTTDGENSTMVVENVDYIQVVDKLVGFVRYDGDKPAWMSKVDNACDSHFIAFSTDKEIDTLLEADVYYKQRWVQCMYPSFDNGKMYWDENKFEYGNWEDAYSYLSHTDLFYYDGQHFDFKRQRIQTVGEFIQSEKFDNEYNGIFLKVGQHNELTEQAEQDLRGKDWIIRFAETEYRIHQPADSPSMHATDVGHVSILRLKFKTDGVIYDLGVVDNKQTGSGDPLNKTTYTYELADTFKIILAILLLIVLIVVLLPILPTIISIIFTMFKLLLKIIGWIISLPFKVFKAIFKKRE